MASAGLSRRVEKVVGYPPLSEMGRQQRREFPEALLDADSFEDLPGKWQAAILEAEQNRPKLLRAAPRRVSAGPRRTVGRASGVQPFRTAMVKRQQQQRQRVRKRHSPAAIVQASMTFCRFECALELRVHAALGGHERMFA